MTISVSGRTWTIPFGVVCIIAKGKASAKRVIPGMKILSPATTGLLFSPLRAKPSIPGPNLTFCLEAMTGESVNLVHGFASTLRMVTLEPNWEPAFLRIIPSTRMTPRLASSGLGYRFSKVLAKCGAKVALSARRVDKLDKLAEEIKSEGGECMVVPIDMVDRESIRAAVKKVEDVLGTINTLINNAGMVDAQWAIKQSDELIDGVVATNLVGPYLLSNEVARRLIDKKEPGRMVNIASMAAYNINPNSASVLYSTTKSAIVRMTESLSVEWARNHINVNAIAPGMFSSEMLDGMLERIGDVSQSLPRKRICMPEQMDSTLLYLVSPSSECVTGTCIKIDDGQSSR